MANTSVVYLDADFVGLGWGYFDILDGQVLAGFPGDGGLWHARELLTQHKDGCLQRTLQVMVYSEFHQSQSTLGLMAAYLSNGVGRHDEGGVSGAVVRAW